MWLYVDLNGFWARTGQKEDIKRFGEEECEFSKWFRLQNGAHNHCSLKDQRFWVAMSPLAVISTALGII